jgi:DNA-binding response OmpR family regulator
MSSTSILVVEDERSTLDELCEFLRDEGYDVEGSSDGKEALEKFQKDRFDIVITDVKMPKMDGIELLRRIKKLNQRTSVVIVTGHGTEEVAVSALRAGASNYIKKPIDLGELERVTQTLVMLARSLEIDVVTKKILREESRRLVFPSSPEIVPAIIGNLCASLPLVFDLTTIERIEIALGEMIQNALEHGNLEISYEEKARAHDAGVYLELLNSRLRDTGFGSRAIDVFYHLWPEGVEFTIRDQGKGFDWRGVMDAIYADGIVRHSGRGIILTSYFVDEIKYNEKGNEVRLVKHLSPVIKNKQSVN